MGVKENKTLVPHRVTNGHVLVKEPKKERTQLASSEEPAIKQNLLKQLQDLFPLAQNESLAFLSPSSVLHTFRVPLRNENVPLTVSIPVFSPLRPDCLSVAIHE